MIIKNRLNRIMPLLPLLVVLLLMACRSEAISFTPVPPATSTPNVTSTSMPEPTTAFVPPTATLKPTSTPIFPTATPLPPTPTQSPMLSIKGSIEPWDQNTSKIANREIVLCAIQGSSRTLPSDCMLMKTAVMTDVQGNFEFYGIPPGSYYVLYDSGLEDFKAGLAYWGGKVLFLGDTTWLTNTFMGEGSTSSVTCHIPDALPNPLPFDRKVLVAWSLSFLHCQSPFIVAQKQTGIFFSGMHQASGQTFTVASSEFNTSFTAASGANFEDAVNNPVYVRVTNNPTVNLSFPVMYFGE